MEFSASRRRRGRALQAAVVVVVFFAIVARRNSHRPPKSDAAATTEPVSTAKYVPAKTEGLGVSVAILIDNSGSMKDKAGGDQRPKYQVARQALEAMLATTDSFVARQPDVPVNVGLYQFSSGVQPLVAVRPYDRTALHSALESMSLPSGGTAIGAAMDVARADLYQAGTIRKYILVVTDGQNTEGRSPDKVAHEIDQRSEGAVRMYFVAFDVEASRFDFLRDVHGEVLEARNGLALHAGLDSLYRGKILAEALDAGETLADTSASRPASPSPADSSHPARPPKRPRKPTP